MFPPSLIGGISGRNAEESEWQLSLDLQDESSEYLAVFLDRFKCFDLVIPQVSLGIASKLGLPSHIHRAALGFYDQQVKFFKLGSAFGRRVMSANSAVKGCSLSILMVNCMYAVFSKHVEAVCPSIAFRSFVDDAKFWALTRHDEHQKMALSEAEQFDESEDKSSTRRKLLC